MLLQPTCPLRETKDINSAIKELKDNSLARILFAAIALGGSTLMLYRYCL